MNLPETTAECGGCDEAINLLSPYLKVVIKAERRVLVATSDVPEDLNAESVTNVYLGTRRGRGRIVCFHDFDCLSDYASAREGQKARIEVHAEDEIYEPADNRTPEELVADGEMSKALAAVVRGEEG